MSKKKFNSGLESLFSEGADQDLEQGKVTLLNTRKKRSSSNTSTKTSTKAQVKTDAAVAPVKSFTSDLDSLFNDVMTEAIEEKVESIITEKERPRRKRRVISSKPLSGLDALFRRTVDKSEEEEEVKIERNIKRVSFTFHKDRLMKLKSIAKLEKSYLKDIISEVVSEYIDEYEKKAGTAIN